MMAPTESPTKQRRAPKSCTECRRRKIRCTWSSPDSQTCRRCEERGVACIAQTAKASNVGPRGTSKARLLQLETEVARLRKSVNVIEAKLGTQTLTSWASDAAISTVGNDYEMNDIEDGSDDDDDQSSSRSSEVIVEDRPTHMNSLFSNEWISTDTQQSLQLQHNEQRRTITQLLDKARTALQPLVPESEEVSALSGYVSEWLSILQDLSPTTSLASSREGIIASYEEMKRPDVDTFRLSCWLLALAISSQQLQMDVQSPASFLSSFRKRSNYAQMVQRTVESHVIVHDSLLGTVPGIETALMYMRLNLTRGVLQKSWLGLRRIIAIGELIGLPRMSRLMQQYNQEGLQRHDQNMANKARLWESLCAVERLAGTLMNFPVATRPYSVSSQQPLVSNGKVHAPTFWLKLSDIAIQVQDLDDLQASPASEAELHARVLQLDGELRSLAWATPKDWWTPAVPGKVNSSHLLQFQHHCITMRVHLPFTLKSDPTNHYTYSRTAGIEACEAVARSWCYFRRCMPFGIFFSRPLDAQAFAAAVVLILTDHDAQSGNRTQTGEKPTDRQNLLQHVRELMEEKAKEPVGSDSARQATVALRALMPLLNGDQNEKSQSNGLTLKVPLLGTIKIRRKLQHIQQDVHAHKTVQLTQNKTDGMSSTWPAADQPTLSVDYASSMPQAQLSGVVDDTTQDMFSWIINADDEALFQDNLMMEEYNTFNPWYPS